jgi:hypothetical protein
MTLIFHVPSAVPSTGARESVYVADEVVVNVIQEGRVV